MNRSAEQKNRVNREAVLVRFVCSALRFISHEPRKKDTHSLYLQCLQQRFLLKFSEQSKKFKFPSEIGNLTLFPDKSQNSAWRNGEKGDLSCMFFNSHFNSNNINSILELNYMNFFYINAILSHHEYTECRAAECPVLTNRNTDRKTQTTRIERWPWHCKGIGLAPPPFKSLRVWFVQLPGTTSWHELSKNELKNFSRVQRRRYCTIVNI